MTVTDQPVQTGERQIVSEPESSRAWWFLGTLAVLRNPEGAPRTPVVMELHVPPGGSPPEHVHQALDDAFYLLDGELVVRCGDRTLFARPGAYVVLPHGVPHTFRVTSRKPARMLQVHEDDSFLGLVETLGTPTTEHRLPPTGEFDVDLETLMRASEEHGAPMIGPSLDEDAARRFATEARGEPTLGAVNHISLNVTDLARSEQWYSQAFGLIRVDGEIAEDGSGHIALLSPAGGWILTLASAPAAAVEHVALTCDDRAALVSWRDALAKRGLEPGTITDAAYGSGFVLRDPDGFDVELFTPAPQNL
jgi:mannose-6-phosphate isomerase-like protein (cupin superfamily)/catechol 2,3-dioxygenase-like lactoylglutathione lyase family enzyme